MSGENKEQTFTFPDRWQAYIEELPAEEVKALMIAMCRHAFGGEAPADLSLAVRMAMVDVRSRIDWERGVKEARANAGKASGRARNTNQQGPTPTDTDEQTRTNANKREQTRTNDQQTGTNANIPKDRDRDRDIKEAELSLCEEKRRKPRGFKSWTPEEFRREAEKVAATRPEWAEILEDFVGYWCEPRGDGSPRFRGQEAFEIGRRFSTFRRRDSYGRPPVGLHPAARADMGTAGKHTEEIYREEQEAEARRRAQGIDETAELYRAEMEAAGK